MKQIQTLEELDSSFTLVDFFATWCGPCKMQSFVLEELVEKINIVKVDIDQATELANKFHIMAVPTLVLMKNKEMLDQKVGYQSKDEIEEWIEEFQK